MNSHLSPGKAHRVVGYNYKTSVHLGLIKLPKEKHWGLGDLVYITVKIWANSPEINRLISVLGVFSDAIIRHSGKSILRDGWSGSAHTWKNSTSC